MYGNIFTTFWTFVFNLLNYIFNKSSIYLYNLLEFGI